MITHTNLLKTILTIDFMNHNYKNAIIINITIVLNLIT